MASMDRVLELNFRSTDEEIYFQETHDWAQSHVLQEPRHVDKIEGCEVPVQEWRLKDKMKTVSVALVVCLNIGVDPPGLMKLQPCARFECWMDPSSSLHTPQKALEKIGQALQKQYERWQPRARYKISLDPTVDEVKKLCTSLRRNAKEERVLFHYNGHGVPCPTTNGEIWVFNRNYSEYVPLSIYDLQTWMGCPSIYVYDCNNAGLITKSFHKFAKQHESELLSEVRSSETTANGGETGGVSRSSNEIPHPPDFASCIQLAACSESQMLPTNPDLPADLFTACLTTPIRMALRWFVLQNQGTCGGSGGRTLFNKLVCDEINLETVERVPGYLNDRRTMLGELNWIFTSITDTIAWNLLPKQLFQKLFRQDLLVASLFRNFLLAERIMKSYNCNPESSPKLPPTSHHPMWHTWDYALDQCLSQLKTRENSGPVLTPEQFTYVPSLFFEEQLTAFEVWIGLGHEKRDPPEQLPIVLQVLLSQVHRVGALELLGKFLDLGWWAVNLALSVGIFPYILKLLQSNVMEIRPLLVSVWAKILAVDQTCQTDLVQCGSHNYFISMVNDTSLSIEYRTMAVFVLSNIVRSYLQGQQAALQANSISTCLLALEEDTDSTTSTPASLSNLHKWVCICLGLTWQDFPDARWCAVRDSAHEKIAKILADSNPEVRAAAVFALGSFINEIDRTEHSNSIDHACVLMILNKLGDREASALVRQEIVVALHNFVLVFENQFVSCAERNMAIESQYFGGGAQGFGSLLSPVTLRMIGNNARMCSLLGNNGGNMMTITGNEVYSAGKHAASGGGARSSESVRRVASSSSLSNLMNIFIPPATVGLPSSSSSSIPYRQHSPTFAHFHPPPSSPSPVTGIYNRVYNYLASLERDPYPDVALLARTVLDHLREKAIAKSQQQSISKSFIAKELESSSESKPETPTGGRSSPSTPVSATDSVAASPSSITPIIATKYVNWCWSQFSRSCECKSNRGTGGGNVDLDPRDPTMYTRSWVYSRNAKTRRDCFKRVKSFPGKIEEQVVTKNLNEVLRNGGGTCIKFHPYENLVVVAGPAVLDGSGRGNGQASVTGSLNSLDVEKIGSNMNIVIDKSVFLILEYDDASYLSSHHPYQQSSNLLSSSPSSVSSSSSISPPSSRPQTPTSFSVQPRVINRTKIEHTSNSYVYSSHTTPPLVTSLEWINVSNSIVTDVSSLLATGCNDGCVRIYKPLLESRQSSLVTAWAVSSLARVNGLQIKYEQESTNLVVAYNSSRTSCLGIWNIGCERLVREIGGGGLVDKASKEDGLLGEFVSCLDCNRCEPNVFVLGGDDGSVRLIDLRVAHSQCVTSMWRDLPSDNGSVQSVRLRHDRTIVAGSANGRVRYFDLRSKTPTKTFEAAIDVTAVDVHPNLPYFSLGTTSSTVNVYGFHGQTTFLSNSIREGFGRFGRLGLANNSITSVAFHDFKPIVGFVDSYSNFSIYKARK